ncbi:C25 family cysteine peptidase [Acidobacteriota bacterium]
MSIRTRRLTKTSRYFALLPYMATGVMCLATNPGWAQGIGIPAWATTCVNESNNDTNVCTANDLTFVQLGLGIQSDGCVDPTDRVKIYLKGALQNSTANTRYDVGVWFPRDESGTIDPNGDGALSGLCNLVGLMNAESPPTDLCVPAGGLDLTGGSGPWVNADGVGYYDACGDMYNNSTSTACDSDGDGLWDDSIIWVDTDIEFDCTDTDLLGVSDGFVNMPICLTWGNNSRQVDNDGNGLCDDMTELQPGTKSKCRCELYEPTDIPAPNLTLDCTLPGGETVIQSGDTIDVTYTYDNLCTCTPGTEEERFRCCTASFLQFPVTYDATYLSVSVVDAGNGTFVSSAGVVTWTPGSDGIIAQDETDSMTITFLALAAGEGQNITIPAASYWSNDGTDFDPSVLQTTLSSQCGFEIYSTWAAISRVKADVRSGQTVVSWESSAEIGSVGYDVFRGDASGEQWTKVNQHLLPALADGPGGRYELVDHDAPTEGIVTYKVREVDTWGGRSESPATKVELQESSRPAPVDGFVAKGRAPSRRLIEARDRSRVHSKSNTDRRTPSVVGRRSQPDAFAKVGVRETGLYRLSAAAIASALGEPEAKIEAAIKKQKLALKTGGEPVAWLAERDNQGLLFFGQAPDNIFDVERIYVLARGQGTEFGRGTGSVAQPTDGAEFFRAEAPLEENLLLRPFRGTEADKDFWYWAYILTGNATFGTAALEFDLEEVAAFDASARLDVAFDAFGPESSFSGAVHVNDNYVGDLEGAGTSSGVQSFEFDQAFLHSGANTVAVIGQQSGFYVDRMVLAYDRLLHTSVDELALVTTSDDPVSIDGFSMSAVGVFDVSDAFNPILMPVAVTPVPGDASFSVSFTPMTDDGDYLAVSRAAVRAPSSIAARSRANLRDFRRQADYVIVTTAELASTAERLAAYRTGLGLEAVVVDVEDIFDDFSFGSRDPAAIQAFVAYAVDHWATPPRYLLLAGRGHYDYKDYLGYRGNLLPPLLAATARGLLPSDNKIADVDGDGLPDLAVGRFPVLTPEGLARVIDKIIAFENAEDGPWSQRVVLMADNPDDAGDFIASSDALELALAGERQAEKVYLSQPYSAEEAHDLIVAALDDGAGILSWVGHAGLDSLAHERLLEISDLEDLQPTDHPSVFMGLTCLMNMFGFPYFAALGEEMLLEPDGGAIAVWSATGFSGNTQAERLGESFFAEVDRYQDSLLGDIIKGALENSARSTADSQIIDVYLLFGDPALGLK